VRVGASVSACSAAAAGASSFFARAGLEPEPIASISICESLLRKPVCFLYPFFGRYLPMRIFSPSTCWTTRAVTVTPSGERFVSPSPPVSRTRGVKVLPSSSRTRSTRSFWPSETRYCFPPTEMIAYGMTRKRGLAPASGRSVATAVWILFGAAALAILVTYSRVPPDELYHTSEGGLAGGLGRALVFLNFPTALAAIGVLLACAPALAGRARVAAGAACVLCLVVVVPGVVDQDDLDAKLVNLVPAAGVALAFALTLHAPARAALLAGDRLRLALGIGFVVIAAPWVFAELGFYAPDPILANERGVAGPGSEETLAAVHFGHHHGTDGTLLALAALLLSRVRPLTRAASVYAALMLAYGGANALQDFSTEQVVKRGWTGHALPSFLRPQLSVAWLAMLGVAALIELLWFSREREPRQRRPASARKSSSHSDIGT
jgi:hypothetical protein